MRLHQTSLFTLTLMMLTTGCSMSHGDPKNPKKNPHPVKRYEVTATADAPGPWDSVIGSISYEVVNEACAPEDKFLGVHAMPQGVGHHVEMTRVDEKTWKGSFYGDFMLDENYYGLGVCHWNATNVGGVFVAHGEKFGSGDVLEDLLKKGSQTEYFKKIDFLNLALLKGGALVFSADNPEVLQRPSDFFPITIAVKEATP